MGGWFSGPVRWLLGRLGRPAPAAPPPATAFLVGVDARGAAATARDALLAAVAAADGLAADATGHDHGRATATARDGLAAAATARLPP